jgi:transcriptional regulator with XRE-family HTH domain
MGMPDRPTTQTLSRLRTGPLIREVRRLAGLSQHELADLLGTKQSVISRWERGLDTPRVDTLARILQACGFEGDLTFRRHDDEDRSQIAMHLDMTPEDRLAYLRDILDFEELAATARPVQRSA